MSDFDRAGTEDGAFVIDRLSPSGYMCYVNCPLDFYYGYIAKIQLPQPVIHLVFGSAVHKAIEEMYNGDPDYTAVFSAHFTPEMLDPESRAKYSEYYLMGLEMLKNYFAQHTALNALYGLNEGKSELRFRNYLRHPYTGQMSSVPLSGIIDRLALGIQQSRVVEYKTAAKEWDTRDPKFRVQSLLYNLWYYTQHGEIADETLYLILLKKFKKHSKDKTLQIIPYKATLDDLASMWEEFELVVEKINAGIFPRGKCNKHMCNCYKYEKLLNFHQHSQIDVDEDYIPF